MKQDDVLGVIAAHHHELRELGVAAAFLYGPIARGETAADCDIDVLVELSRPMGFFQFPAVEDRMAQRLNHPVHLLTPDALTGSERAQVFSEAKQAAWKWGTEHASG